MEVKMTMSVSKYLITPVAMLMRFIVGVVMVMPQPTGHLGLRCGAKNELSNAPNRHPH